MRLKLKGNKYKYSQGIYKTEDDFKVKTPSYSTSGRCKILYNGKWKPCILDVFDSSGKMRILVSPSIIYKDRTSEIGKVDSKGYIDIIDIKGFKRYLILIYDYLFQIKVKFLKLIDKGKLIKENLRYISIAFVGSGIYYLINFIFDGYLQELINKSNFVQSFIVFLSLSSIINIFHPFTLRKELKIEEVDELVSKKLKKAKEDLKREESRNKYMR